MHDTCTFIANKPGGNCGTYTFNSAMFYRSVHHDKYNAFPRLATSRDDSFFDASGILVLLSSLSCNMHLALTQVFLSYG